MNIAFTVADLAKWIAFGSVRVRSVHGFNNQGSDLYIQLHEVSKGTVAASQVAPANATVPKFKSLHAQAGNSFKWEFEDGIVFSELVVAISTTETNLTLVGAAGGLDFTLVADGPYMVDNFPTLTVVGDLTNPVATLQVWAEAAGPNTLVRIDSEKVDPTANYLVGYAVDAPASTSKVQTAVKLGTTSTFIHQSAGQGATFWEKTASDQVLHQGFTLQPQDVITAEANPDLNAKVRAMYI